MKKLSVITASAALMLGITFNANAAVSRDIGANDEYCREYTKQVKVGGRMQESYGTACMKPDGSWEIVSSDDSSDRNVELARNDYRVVYSDAPAYYVPRPYPSYYISQTPSFYFSYNYGSPKYYKKHYDRRWDRDRDHDRRGHRDHDRGRKGHDRDRGRGHHR